MPPGQPSPPRGSPGRQHGGSRGPSHRGLKPLLAGLLFLLAVYVLDGTRRWTQSKEAEHYDRQGIAQAMKTSMRLHAVAVMKEKAKLARRAAKKLERQQEQEQEQQTRQNEKKENKQQKKRPAQPEQPVQPAQPEQQAELEQHPQPEQQPDEGQQLLQQQDLLQQVRRQPGLEQHAEEQPQPEPQPEPARQPEREREAKQQLGTQAEQPEAVDELLEQGQELKLEEERAQEQLEQQLPVLAQGLGHAEQQPEQQAGQQDVALELQQGPAVPVEVGAQRPPLASSHALQYGPQERPMYSTHTCINEKFHDNWHTTTCKFDNLCLNAKTLQFEYYRPPHLKDLPVAYDALAREMRQFSEHLVNMGHARVDITVAVGWRPVVKQRPFPEEGPLMKWAPTSQALLQAFTLGLTTNFGHAIYDTLVPLFSMQHLFGVYTPDAQVLITRTLGGTDDQLNATLGRMINTERPQDSLLRLTWDHNAMWLREYADQELGRKREGLICFRTVLVGTGSLNRQLSGGDALPYRQAAVWRTGLQELPQERPVITILHKEGRRMVENTGDILTALSDRYPGAQVHVFDFGEHPDMSIPDQIKLMSDTSILITPCGGLGTVLTFMRPGATAIVMNYWHTGRNRSLQLEDNYYRNLEYLDIQYFPVTPEEYTDTRDRPGCEQVKGKVLDLHYDLLGALVHCNLRLGAPALQRLVDYVDAAMMRWAAQTGHFDALDTIWPPEAREVDGGDQQLQPAKQEPEEALEAQKQRLEEQAGQQAEQQQHGTGSQSSGRRGRAGVDTQRR